MAAGRADHAEAMVKLQARTIERLIESNERMVEAGRRHAPVGFGILEPIETNDTPATTADYDREAVEQDPELGADDDRLMTTPARIVAMPIWYCSPNELRARIGHVRKHFKEGFHLDQRRIDGHLFFMCDTCKRTALGVVTSRPSPMVTCFAITRAQYDYWITHHRRRARAPLEEDRETQDLLHRLGYNPTYQRRRA
jgi:hypothetical protein